MSSHPETDPENDATLLLRFHRHGEEAAFAALVRRWLPSMEACARRVCGNDSLARDAVQSAFCVLARKAGALASGTVPLAGWLHRAVTLESRNLLRRERSRERALRRFVSENPTVMNPPAEDRWAEVLPHLDEAIQALSATDRELIIQRFFERRSWQEIGAGRGRSPDAARMAIGTALGKLARSLQARGAAVGAAALATGLAGLATPAPASSAEVAGIVRAALPFRAPGAGPVAGPWLAAAVGFVIAVPVTWLAVRPPEPARAAGGMVTRSAGIRAGAGAGRGALSTEGKAFDLAGLLSGLRSLTPSGNDPERLAHLRALLMDVPPAAMPEVLATLKTLKWHTDTRLAAEAFFARWAELDPRAAFAATKDALLAGASITAVSTILATPGLPADLALECATRLHGNVTAETQRAFEALLEAGDWRGLARAVTSPEERRVLVRGVLTFADFKDPGTVALLLPAAVADRQLVPGFSKRWATMDEPAALAWLGTLPRGTLPHHEPALAIAEVIAARDPAQALGLIAAVPFSERFQMQITDLWSGWLKRDRAAAEARLATSGLPPKAREYILLHSR